MNHKLNYLIEALREEGESLDYARVKSFLASAPIGEIDEDIYDDIDLSVATLLQGLGMADIDINEFINGNSRHSKAVMQSLIEADIDLSKETFGYVDMDSVTCDAIAPTCKSGYKRKIVMANGKPKWKCKRVLGIAPKMSPKQKMALQKARRKAHTGIAKHKRAKSAKARKVRGM